MPPVSIRNNGRYQKGQILSQEGICDAFGYPSQATLSRWIRHDDRYEGPRRTATRDAEDSRPPHSAIKYPFAVRAEAVRLALEEGMTRKQVSDKLGLCGAPMVSKWVTVYRKKGSGGLLTRDDMKRAAPAGAGREMPGDVDALKREVEALRLENAILGQKIGILKKDPGVDTGDLTNRERAQVIDALRPAFPLNALLDQGRRVIVKIISAGRYRGIRFRYRAKALVIRLARTEVQGD